MKKVEEASTLGLKPGDWPQFIKHEGVVYIRGLPEVINGETVSWMYRSAKGDKLVVLND